jgi:hypothetical protein
MKSQIETIEQKERQAAEAMVSFTEEIYRVSPAVSPVSELERKEEEILLDLAKSASQKVATDRKISGSAGATKQESEEKKFTDTVGSYRLGSGGWVKLRKTIKKEPKKHNNDSTLRQIVNIHLRKTYPDSLNPLERLLYTDHIMNNTCSMENNQR